jgi:hypothetical protein
MLTSRLLFTTGFFFFEGAINNVKVKLKLKDVEIKFFWGEFSIAKIQFKI